VIRELEAQRACTGNWRPNELGAQRVAFQEIPPSVACRLYNRPDSKKLGLVPATWFGAYEILALLASSTKEKTKCALSIA
jgi:hypothetical protein